MNEGLGALLCQPALSRHVPDTLRLVPSGPVYVALPHDAIPETPSVPENDPETPWLYQPLLSGPRERPPGTIVGGVLSILIGPVDNDAEPTAVVTAHSCEGFTPSFGIGPFWQPVTLVIGLPPSLISHVTVTVSLYQPLSPVAPLIET